MRLCVSAQNNLIGTLPWELSLLTSLQGISLHNNLLSGNIPSQFQSLSRLRMIQLQSNYLTGTIPYWLFGCQRDTHYDDDRIISNRVSTCSLPDVNIVVLAENFFTGTIPSKMPVYSNLIVLDLNGNALTGSIPEELFDFQAPHVGDGGNTTSTTHGSNDEDETATSMFQLQKLRLFENLFSGNIPTTIGNLLELEILVLSYNTLSGTIPSQFGQLPKLAFVGISNNEKVSGASSQTGKPRRDLLLLLTDF